MTKKYLPKTLFTKIFEQHAEHLFLKNYSEKMIDSWSEHGLYVKQLHAAFKQAYITKVENYEIDRFSLDMTGYFSIKRKDGSKTKDKVNFEFAYSYDPSKIELKLTSLKATMNDEFEKTYPILTYPLKDLPTARKVYQELFEIREKILLTKEQEQRQDSKNKKRLQR